MQYIRHLTWQELLDAVSFGPAPHAKQQASQRIEGAYGRKHKGFFGTKDYWQAMDLIKNGWQDGLKQIYELTQKIDAPDTQTFTEQYDVSGSMVDVGRFLSGEPENMLEFVQTEAERRGKVLTINVHIGTSCSIRPLAIMTRGAAICNLIDQLETLGYRVELKAWHSVQYKGTFVTHSIVIKESSEPLQMERVAFAMAHPSMQRRCIFRLMEQTPEPFCNHIVCNHYGYPSDVDAQTYLEGEYIPLMQNNLFESTEYAKGWIAQKVSYFGKD